MIDYRTFLVGKTQSGGKSGFAPVWMPSFLFDFQAALTEWSLEVGRDAILADCGLGKTPMELVWGENVVRKTNKKVLLCAPLAVSHQILREAEKFGIEVNRSEDGAAHVGITVTNYERLHLFDWKDFVGFIGDESSILKNFDGVRREEITKFMRHLPYRLLATATAAPNDHPEVGTTSEALGYLGYMDMLNKFFKNDQNNSSTKGQYKGHGAPRQWDRPHWRFKGHAERAFYRWMCSWARAIRMPSDLGFDNERFILPALQEFEHVVEAATLPEGMLFPVKAVGMREQREERKRTMRERCEKVAELVGNTGKPFLIWCHLNPEGDLLEKMIPDAVQVSGKDSDERKVEKMMAFTDGQSRGLITKQKIGAWGMNWQHCAHIVSFPSHSFEQDYQGLRRCWRFGQKEIVRRDMVTTEGERGVLENLQRKALQADRMFSKLVAEMNAELSIQRTTTFSKPEELPEWLMSNQ
jgi:hypothetical protein